MPAGPLWLNFAARRLQGGELLIVASNTPARAALAAYRKRWAIECLFGDTKSRGLNLEDTRLVTPRKLDLLLGLVALAVAWAAKDRRDADRTQDPTSQDARIPRQVLVPHRLRSDSDRLLRHDPAAAVEPWRVIASSRVRTPRVV